MKRSIATAVLLVIAVAARAQQPSWLDRPLANWNVAGQKTPAAAANEESIAELSKRCALLPLKGTTAGERALADAGWVPFYVFDRQMVQRDVEIVGGLSAADGMCRPAKFNVFVFVSGQLAGTLSPTAMTSRSDGSIGGGVRLAEDETIGAEFARYAEPDPLCCPSTRVTVRYRIDRQSTPPVVVPVSVQPTRR